MTLQPNQKVWRYLSFARFVDLLIRKQLWFSNVENLEDKWEVMLNQEQIKKIINFRPSSLTEENASELINNSIRTIRKIIYVNCWSVNEDESHALWRIYCPSTEGVAIQTTLDRLQKSLPYRILEVSYDSLETKDISLDPFRLATRKRPIYSYEREARIVIVDDFVEYAKGNRTIIGVHVDWDPETNIENIYVHPDASFWFMKTVSDSVTKLAPKLAPNGLPHVYWSTINSPPPIR